MQILHLVCYHKNHGKAITMTAVMPEGQFGVLDIQDNNYISCFKEKPKGNGSWINVGFLYVNRKFLTILQMGKI